jgi:predicted nucleotidyltransferase
LKSLRDHDVDALLIGGFAVGLYGYVRATEDLDIWVRPSSENARKLVEAIKEFGFDAPNLTESLFDHESSIVRMGVKPYLIEILTSVSGVDFQTAWDRRVATEIDGVAIDLIALDDLLANKAAAGRRKDLADIEALQKAKRADAHPTQRTPRRSAGGVQSPQSKSRRRRSE